MVAPAAQTQIRETLNENQARTRRDIAFEADQQAKLQLKVTMRTIPSVNAPLPVIPLAPEVEDTLTPEENFQAQQNQARAAQYRQRANMAIPRELEMLMGQMQTTGAMDKGEVDVVRQNYQTNVGPPPKQGSSGAARAAFERRKAEFLKQAKEEAMKKLTKYLAKQAQKWLMRLGLGASEPLFPTFIPPIITWIVENVEMAYTILVERVVLRQREPMSIFEFTWYLWVGFKDILVLCCFLPFAALGLLILAEVSVGVSAAMGDPVARDLMWEMLGPSGLFKIAQSIVGFVTTGITN